VKVKLYGTLARLAQSGTPGVWCGEIPDGTTIEELIRLLGTRPAEAYVATVAGELRPFNSVIQDGAEVVLVTPFGGG
jgi:molybdopterin converting factor small subunit